jgi:hypothetical protein
VTAAAPLRSSIAVSDRLGCSAPQASCGARPCLRQFINRLKLPQGPYRAHRLPSVALVLQWRQNYRNNLTHWPEAMAAEMGQRRIRAAIKRLIARRCT